MSERFKGQLTAISLIVGITIGVFGAIQSLAVFPYRLDAAEKAVIVLQVNGQRDREALVRMEEQLRQIDIALQKILAKVDK